MTILSIADLDSASPEVQAGLLAHGIRDSADLLEACRIAGGCANLAARVGLEPSTLSHLAGPAALLRLRGVGRTYVKLLEAAGITSPQTLGLRCPEELRATLAQLNAEKRMVGRVPTLAMVTGWVNKARKMPYALWV